MEDLDKTKTKDVLCPDGIRRSITMPEVNWECYEFLLKFLSELEITNTINDYREQHLLDKNYSFEEFYSNGIAIMFNSIKDQYLEQESIGKISSNG
ncbi:hypothetical protein [Aquimarina macrocephali]|uniref:hypothetical protein n=1 Tax=Aquimarina macrocephali TaxID=666563 RepID=UPI0004677B23|nr:hypothetical protein [Aquimarina macrocephali]